MAKTKYDTPEEKKRLQERAEALKPKQPGVIATELGWAVARPNGTLELLVSYKNLDELLGDAVSEVELVGEPIVIKAEEAPAEEAAAEEPAPTDETAPVEKKKPGRPKKVTEVAVEEPVSETPVEEPVAEVPAEGEPQ